MAKEIYNKEFQSAWKIYKANHMRFWDRRFPRIDFLRGLFEKFKDEYARRDEIAQNRAEGQRRRAERTVRAKQLAEKFAKYRPKI